MPCSLRHVFYTILLAARALAKSQASVTLARSRRLFGVLVLLVAATSPAIAGFSVCNKSAHGVAVALGQFNGTRWLSDGWWHIEPKTCTELIAGPLLARYYYLYATDGFFGTWDGDKNFCVAVLEKFSIVGRGACKARGYVAIGFLEVDTGNQLNWTQPLSNPQ